eukprot:PhF_6_TR37739/c0_g1_i1/m.56189
MNLLRFSILTAAVLISTVSAVQHVKGDFSDDQKCPSCILFSTQLHDEMKQSVKYIKDPATLKKILAREDRVIDVLDNSIKRAATHFTWLNDRRSSVTTGRYWSINNLEKRQVLDDEAMRILRKQASVGGDPGLVAFLRQIRSDHEDELEGIVFKGAHVIEPIALTQTMCVKWTKLCKSHDVENTASSKYPMDREDDMNAEPPKVPTHEPQEGDPNNNVKISMDI